MGLFEDEKVELFSNAAHTLPHINTAGNFVNMLPETTDLGNNLEVGVKSISIPSTWEPFKEHTRAHNEGQWVLIQGLPTQNSLKFTQSPHPFVGWGMIQTNDHVTWVGSQNNMLLFTLLPGIYDTNEDLMKQIIYQTHQAFSKSRKNLISRSVLQLRRTSA